MSPPSPPHPPRRRLAEGLAAIAAIWALYAVTGWATLGAAGPAPWVTPLDRAFPFVPAAIWVYIPFYAASFVVAGHGLTDVRSFRAALVALVLVSVLATPVFVLFPVVIPRPAIDPTASVSLRAVSWLYALDAPVNTFPSLHVANSALGALLLREVRARTAPLATTLAVGIAVSVVLLKQHWIADIAGGLFLASVGRACFVKVRAGGLDALGRFYAPARAFIEP